MSTTRVDVVRGAARATKAEVGPFELQLLTFAPGHRIDASDVALGYLVVVLEGEVAKRFGRIGWTLARGSLATLPAGSSHTSDFGPVQTRVLTVRGRGGEEEEAFGGVLRSLRHVHATAATAIGLRLAAELRATDESWPLAAEGLAFQLLSTAGRTAQARANGKGSWLAAARELLHERAPGTSTLTELGAAVGVHPVHLARSFRREYGITVGQYARGLRLDWAAARLAQPDGSLAEIATAAGFADQSHFTRAFRAYAGVTPGRYRALVRR